MDFVRSFVSYIIAGRPPNDAVQEQAENKGPPEGGPDCSTVAWRARADHSAAGNWAGCAAFFIACSLSRSSRMS
jgi:hypothetical protein